jgi:hypothetical protein
MKANCYIVECRTALSYPDFHYRVEILLFRGKSKIMFQHIDFHYPTKNVRSAKRMIRSFLKELNIKNYTIDVMYER